MMRDIIISLLRSLAEDENFCAQLNQGVAFAKAGLGDTGVRVEGNKLIVESLFTCIDIDGKCDEIIDEIKNTQDPKNKLYLASTCPVAMCVMHDILDGLKNGGAFVAMERAKKYADVAPTLSDMFAKMMPALSLFTASITDYQIEKKQNSIYMKIEADISLWLSSNPELGTTVVRVINAITAGGCEGLKKELDALASSETV